MDTYDRRSSDDFETLTVAPGIRIRLDHPPVEAWSNAYIGLPWQDRGLTRAGIACWGLARLVYAEQHGLVLPDYASEVPDVEDGAAVASVYARAKSNHPWIAVDPTTARPFDILVFRRDGLDAHVGIFVEPDKMLHITEGEDSHLADQRRPGWAGRLSGVYRHHALLGGTVAA